MQFFLALLLLASVAHSPVAMADTTIEIPVILSLTGNAAFAGHDDAEVVSILESYVNATGGIRGTPLHFTILDDQSSPQAAVQLMNSADDVVDARDQA
jgi:ABC-type branched-subunit amino acid transport system substrate-binding protein